MKKAIVLLSGGLDSTTCLALALSEGYHCTTLSFDYGQRHIIELDTAIKIAAQFNVKHDIIKLPSMPWHNSALTNSSIDIPEYTGKKIIPVTYVPARNTLFLSFALAYADVLKADAIFIGVSSVDYSGYPDCRPEYIEAYQTLANLATKSGVEGQAITIRAPLIHLSKAQTIALGHELHIDYHMTVSCYQANEKGEACGKCDSCALRKKGFHDANIADETRYYTSIE